MEKHATKQTQSNFDFLLSKQIEMAGKVDALKRLFN